MSDPHPSLVSPHDVVIAGAGPVGLFLACELRLAGLSVLVLEQAGDPRATSKRLPFGLRGLSQPTLRSLARRGLLHDIAEPPPARDDAGSRSGVPVAHWMDQTRRPAGHFAGIPVFLDKVDLARWPSRQAGPGRPAELERIETVLATRAQAMGVEIRHGLAVEGLDPASDHVVVHAGRETFRGRWLVGCDGGRSTVRKAGGFAFTGTDPEFTGYSVDVELTDPDALHPGRHATATGMYTYTQPGTVALVEFDGGAAHRAQPLTLAHVEAVLRRVSGVDVTVTALRFATTWTDRAHQATAYRNGRILLAGDAAHIHSPLGGQGLNLGLGDAMNLGWKLAATVRGDAPAGLLESYAVERHPVGAQVLDWSRAQVALMRPDPGSRALRAITRDLIDTCDGATYVAGRLWGMSLRYELGGTHPLVGQDASDGDFADGPTLDGLLRSGKGVWLDFDARRPLRALASRWSDRVVYVAHAARDGLGLSAVLLRPDGVVAWAGEASPDEGEAARATSRWFGAPGDLRDASRGRHVIADLAGPGAGDRASPQP